LPCIELNVYDLTDPNGKPLLEKPISARLPSGKSRGVNYACKFDRKENKAFLALLTAFAAAHPEKVTPPFPKSGFAVELDHAGRWVHKPRPGVNSSVTDFYSLHLVHHFVGIKRA
jgi:hypothetical protein